MKRLLTYAVPLNLFGSVHLVARQAVTGAPLWSAVTTVLTRKRITVTRAACHSLEYKFEKLLGHRFHSNQKHPIHKDNRNKVDW